MILLKDGRAACMSCGYKPKKTPKIQASEKLQNEEAIAVIKEDADETYPVIDMKCQKCDHKKSYFWTKQTRAADESETKFYKCVKCKHTWREYK